MTAETILDAIVDHLQNSHSKEELFIDKMPDQYFDETDEAYFLAHERGSILPHIVNEDAGEEHGHLQPVHIKLGITMYTHAKNGKNGLWEIGSKIRRILTNYTPKIPDNDEGLPLMPMKHLRYDGHQLAGYENGKWISLMQFSLETTYTIGT